MLSPKSSHDSLGRRRSATSSPARRRAARDAALWLPYPDSIMGVGDERAYGAADSRFGVAEASLPRVERLPRTWSRRYTPARADQLQRENRALDLPAVGGFVRSMVELEAEAERQSLISARRSRMYASLYYIFGLPAAVLAAIAGATALASTTGRVVAGIIALTSSALSAAVVFLDSGKQRDRSAQTRAYWDDLYNEIHVARLTNMRDYTNLSGPTALNDFYTRASSIRAGRNPEDAVGSSQSAATGYDAPPTPLFPQHASSESGSPPDATLT